MRGGPSAGNIRPSTELVDASVHLPMFTAKVPGMLRAEELRIFSYELQQFYEGLHEMVVFTTHETWLEFEIGIDQPGQVILAGTVTDAWRGIFPDNL